MNRKKDVVVVIPTYNESKNIKEIIESIFSLGGNFHVVVVDDNSPDGTSQEVEKIKEIHSRLTLITRKDKLGLGVAYREAFEYVLGLPYEVIVQMDADASHPVSSIPAMVELISEYDLVVGSRYIEESKIIGWSLGRTLLSRSGNIFAKVLLGIPINDLTSGFKCMKREVLKSINFNKISATGYFFQIEMVFLAFVKGFSVTEQPIVFEARRKGKSKMSLCIIIEAFLKVIVLCFKKILIRHSYL